MMRYLVLLVSFVVFAAGCAGGAARKSAPSTGPTQAEREPTKRKREPKAEDARPAEATGARRPSAKVDLEVADKVEEAPPPTGPEEPEEAGEYERLLGTFSLNPDLVIYLTPPICERFLDSDDDDSEIRRIMDQFQQLRSPRGEAAARLNRGAIRWFAGDEKTAYQEMMAAQRIFAELGDVDGLAHVFEWLGYFLKESGAEEKAGEHLAAAYQLFDKMSNRAAATRVLNYGD